MYVLPHPKSYHSHISPSCQPLSSFHHILYESLFQYIYTTPEYHCETSYSLYNVLLAYYSHIMSPTCVFDMTTLQGIQDDKGKHLYRSFLALQPYYLSYSLDDLLHFYTVMSTFAPSITSYALYESLFIQYLTYKSSSSSISVLSGLSGYLDRELGYPLLSSQNVVQYLADHKQRVQELTTVCSQWNVRPYFIYHTPLMYQYLAQQSPYYLFTQHDLYQQIHIIAPHITYYITHDSYRIPSILSILYHLHPSFFRRILPLYYYYLSLPLQYESTYNSIFSLRYKEICMYLQYTNKTPSHREIHQKLLQKD